MNKSKRLTIRLTDDELRLLKLKAERFHGGNISKFILEAAITWVPMQKNAKTFEKQVEKLVKKIA